MILVIKNGIMQGFTQKDSSDKEWNNTGIYTRGLL
jgi:hypothetical protein